MRIRSLSLTAFGAFTGRELVFAGDGIPGGTLHVVYGPNEAGKSTALRAVSGLLFGIPQQTSDAHLHAASEMRVGGVLEGNDGTVVEVVRRKGNKKTLMDAAGNVVDESLLRRLYGGATEATFRALFGLDHVSLREGAEALLAGQGDVGESLFEAAVGGGRGIHQVLQELEAEADALFTPKGNKRKLNEALHAYQLARTNLRERTRTAEAWLTQTRGLDEAKTDYAALAETLRSRKRDLHRLERARRLLPLVARRDRIMDATRKASGAAGDGESPAQSEVIVLPIEAARMREAALLERRRAAAELARLSGEIGEITERRDLLSVPAWLDHPMVARLADLQDRLGAHRKAAQDRPRLSGTLAAHEAEAAALRLQLGGTHAMQAAEISGAGLTVAERARVLSLSRLEAALVQNNAQTQRALYELERRQQARTDELQALPVAADSASLRRVLRRIERDGDVETRFHGIVEEKEKLAAALGRLIVTLGLFRRIGPSREAEPMTADEVIALPVPVPESIDKFASESQEVAAREDRLTDDLAGLNRKARAIDRKMGELTRAGEVPSVDALLGARNVRNQSWHRLREILRSRLMLGSPVADPLESGQRQAPSPVESKSVAPPQMPAATAIGERLSDFEAAIARADQAADGLWREADRVAAAAALTADRDEVTRLIADADVQRQHLGRRRAATAVWWNALWAGVGVDPQGAEDMRGWLRRFAEASDIARRLEKATTDSNKMSAQIRRARDELASALGSAAAPRDPAADLATWCEQAASMARLWDDTASRRAALERELTQIAEETTRAVYENSDAEANLTAWRADWGRAIAPLGLPASASTAEAEAVLELAASLARKQGEVGDTRRRLQAIDRDARQFEREVSALTAALTPDLAERSVEEAAEIILQRHREGIPARQARADLDSDLQRRQQARRVAADAHAAAEDQLTALMRAAGVSDLASLEAAERRSDELLELRRDLGECEDQIFALSDGLTLEAAMAEFAGLAAEDLDERTDRLRDEIDALDRDTQNANRAIGSIEGGLKVLRDDDTEGQGRGAADASEDVEGHLARIRGLAVEYARLRLAARLLRGEIERYREQHQGPVLSRAGVLLSRLTLGRYTALRTDFDETDRPVLRCVRADGSKVAVEGLSDGTRDQLYLALRLATLELQATSAEPLPLILDDILIHFDDDRAGAALGVLAEHARGTQVVLFTHHARIVDLARKTVPAQALRVSRLEG